MRRPSTAFPPTGAPRRHGARAEVDGERGGQGTRRRPPFHPPPGRGMERDGGSAHPGRAPRPRASHTPPTPRRNASGPDGTGACPGHARETRTRGTPSPPTPPIASAAPTPGLARAGRARTEDDRGAGGRTAPPRSRGAPRRSGRKRERRSPPSGDGPRATSAGRWTSGTTGGRHRRSERTRVRTPRVHPREEPRAPRHARPEEARPRPRGRARVVRERKEVFVCAPRQTLVSRADSQ